MWAEEFEGGDSILKIAARHGVDPGTISKWLHRLGVDVYSGRHFVKQPDLQFRPELVNLALQGPRVFSDFVRQRVWGVSQTEFSENQLSKFCEFVNLHQQGKGVEEIAGAINVHRSTVTDWRKTRDQPIFVKIAEAALEHRVKSGWKILPMHIGSGGNAPVDWIQVPTAIRSYGEIAETLKQPRVTPTAWELARALNVPIIYLNEKRSELFAYLLGILLGDAGKEGGWQLLYNSANIDLQFTQKEPANERLGDFVRLCSSAFGIEMKRTKDKAPTGYTKRSKNPTPAYRWVSERSPFLGWMISVALGLKKGETTSLDPVRLEWISLAPFDFRKRFVQALADSDASVKKYEVVITSVPNADFLTQLLRRLGLKSAHTIYEKGQPLRTQINAKESALLPIFNEMARGPKYQKLIDRV